MLEKIKALTEAGVTVIGSKPTAAIGLTNYPQNDERVHILADEMWGPGRVISDQTLDEIVQADGLAPELTLAFPTDSIATLRAAGIQAELRHRLPTKGRELGVFVES